MSTREQLTNFSKIHFRNGLVFERTNKGITVTKYIDARCMFGPEYNEVIPIDVWENIVEAMSNDPDEMIIEQEANTLGIDVDTTSTKLPYPSARSGSDAESGPGPVANHPSIRELPLEKRRERTQAELQGNRRVPLGDVSTGNLVSDRPSRYMRFPYPPATIGASPADLPPGGYPLSAVAASSKESQDAVNPANLTDEERKELMASDLGDENRPLTQEEINNLSTEEVKIRESQRQDRLHTVGGPNEIDPRVEGPKDPNIPLADIPDWQRVIKDNEARLLAEKQKEAEGNPQAIDDRRIVDETGQNRGSNAEVDKP